MPAQTPIDRVSTRISLEDRYATQKAGGAFNAKDVRNQPGDFGLQNQLFQDPTGFADKTYSQLAFDFAAKSGHTTEKYKP
jgi:hypothetical protein